LKRRYLIAWGITFKTLAIVWHFITSSPELKPIETKDEVSNKKLIFGFHPATIG